MTETAFPSLNRFNLDYTALRTAHGLQKLDAAFMESVQQQAPDTAQKISEIRQQRFPSDIETSEWLIEIGIAVEAFIEDLFEIQDDVTTLRQEIHTQDPIMKMKAGLISRRARRFRGVIEDTLEDLHQWTVEKATQYADHDTELGVALFYNDLVDQPDRAADLEKLVKWASLSLKDRKHTINWISFNLPQRVDHAHLVQLEPVKDDPIGRLQAKPIHWRQRDGFGLTDERGSQRAIQDQVHYCIYCHDHEGDFCSKGFPEKKGSPELGLKKDPLGNILTGCPVEERISEMHWLRRQCYPIAALAMAMRDNPMLPITGHRICNDCMKACIYQKQDPVNIPQIETRTLTDILSLPWGVEIYDLLTRWNPLRSDQPVMAPYNGHRVLIAGMGPAGFTMAHHLTMAGCAVTGIDGLKIEPLPEQLLMEPVKDWASLVESLDNRILLGFGGVAEYGITPRWDKNFLKLIYLTLLRRPNFQVFGGIRLGGTLRIEDAWNLGFDHLCLATGAGLPRVIPIGNSLARGMRQASDFLMALQLTGAGKADSLANLQVRLPAVVIGGGLTAIDTATEVQTYYIRQVEKILARYEALGSPENPLEILPGLNSEDIGILNEFLEHGQAVRAEREQAQREHRDPNFIALIRQWGGVTLAYRKGMNNSPAYLRNHEEILKATEEGIFYAEGLDPIRLDLDEHQQADTLVCRKMILDNGVWVGSDIEVALPARSVFVAAGTVPNTIYEREYPGTFELDGTHYQPFKHHQQNLQPVDVANHCKANDFGVFTSYNHHEHNISFIGDTNPVFNGSVVKAVASAKRSYPEILNALASLPIHKDESLDTFQSKMDHLLTARVSSVQQKSTAIAELWIEAPMAAKNFKPGQFFRLQTYETGSPIVDDTRLQIPVITVSGTGVEDNKIRLLVLQWGTGPRLVSRLKPGDPLILMGPTGAPIPIPTGKTVMIVAGRWGAAIMLDLGPALKAAGNRVVYVAAFNSAHEVDRQDELEKASDQIIWVVGQGNRIEARRPQDISVMGNDAIAVLQQYAQDTQTETAASQRIPLDQIDQLMVMGSTGLLGAFQAAIKKGGRLQPYVHPDMQAYGTVGSPMQCMLKGVCGQCLQWQIDPETGQRVRAVFSCSEQDQPLSWIDIGNLSARQTQNRLTDRLSARWLDSIMTRHKDLFRA